MFSASASAICSVPARILAALGAAVLGFTVLVAPASAATATYNSVTVFGNATNGTLGSLYTLAQLDAVGGSGSDGSGSVRVTNLNNNVSYTATLNCVLETTNAQSQRVLHVTGTVNPGSVTDKWFTMTLVATPLLGGTANRVSLVGVNHRNTKPYNCTVPAVINHLAVAGLLSVS